MRSVPDRAPARPPAAKRPARGRTGQALPQPPVPSQDELRPLAVAVAEGYRRGRRDLPWRKVRDPYAIWVSEIMLQQTRVATVIPYWQRWMQRFPSVAALAAAPLDDVLAAWSGLGFYGRARNLHRGAREVMASWAGELPSSAAELRQVPGIGPYTAGAISSIAHGERAALVDGNVARVFARVFALDADIKASATGRVLWEHAHALMQALPASYAAGELNEGLMELGATVCSVSDPRCLSCPVAAAAQCRAAAQGLQSTLPVSRAGKPVAELPVLHLQAVWAMRGQQVVLARRRPEGLFGGLWELPSAASLPAAAAVVGARVEGTAAVAHHDQILSHRRLRIDVWSASAPATLGKPQDPSYDAVRYVSLEELSDLAISAATAALLAKYKDAPWTSIQKPSRSSPKGTQRSSKGSASSATTSPTPTSPRPRRARPRASTSSSTTRTR
ncbi:MAG: A/G-specific adenine glycosylase [Myxococcales bacterium]|nr:A/G-specific adenine glycosylase [Myxococcales bacterium]